MLDKVVILGGGPESSLAATTLTLISGDRCALNVAVVSNGDSNVFIGYQVFYGKLGAFIDDFCAASITKLFLYFLQLLADYPAKGRLTRKNILKLGYLLDDCFILVSDLLTLKGRQAAQLQI